MNTIQILILTVGSLFIAYECIQIIRLEILNKKYGILHEAIHLYIQALDDPSNCKVNYRDINNTDRLIYDITAWSYSDLMEPNKLKIIEKYINKVKEAL